MAAGISTPIEALQLYMPSSLRVTLEMVSVPEVVHTLSEQLPSTSALVRV